MKRQRNRMLAFPLLGLLMVGCGGGPGMAPVAGTVTLNGKPVEGIKVIFEPILGESDVTDQEYYTSFGVTDEAGRFAMQTEVQNQLRTGAVVGNSTVRFVCTKRVGYMNRGLADSRAAYDLPKSARDKSMKFAVETQGSTEANFDLTGKINPGEQQESSKNTDEGAALGY